MDDLLNDIEKEQKHDDDVQKLKAIKAIAKQLEVIAGNKQPEITKAIDRLGKNQDDFRGAVSEMLGVLTTIVKPSDHSDITKAISDLKGAISSIEKAEINFDSIKKELASIGDALQESKNAQWDFDVYYNNGHITQIKATRIK